jgi:hypothetical protein
MEIFIVSFLIILVSCAGLAAGQWFGRDPIHGGCRPGDASGGCKRSGPCNLRCANRSRHGVKPES